MSSDEAQPLYYNHSLQSGWQYVLIVLNLKQVTPGPVSPTITLLRQILWAPAGHSWRFLEHYLILHARVQHVSGQLPLQAVLDGKIHCLRFNFGLLGLRGLVGLLLLLVVLHRLKNTNRNIKIFVFSKWFLYTIRASAMSIWQKKKSCVSGRRCSGASVSKHFD